MYFDKHRQSGFTLVEISIVLVIIGILLGGVLKGQEMIKTAKVKAMANEIRSMGAAYYTYQDKFHAVPGDDSSATTHLGATANGVTVVNSTDAANGLIDGGGAWVGNVGTAPTGDNQPSLFWNHTRAAGLLSGDGNIGSATNAVGGALGIKSTSISTDLSGTAFACSGALDDKMAAQLDATIDDGNGGRGTAQSRIGAQVVAAGAPDSYTAPNIYTLCSSL